MRRGGVSGGQPIQPVRHRGPTVRGRHPDDVGTAMPVDQLRPGLITVGLKFRQGRGDGPKAGTSGASEAARAKPGAQTGEVCFD